MKGAKGEFHFVQPSSLVGPASLLFCDANCRDDAPLRTVAMMDSVKGGLGRGAFLRYLDYL